MSPPLRRFDYIWLSVEIKNTVLTPGKEDTHMNRTNSSVTIYNKKLENKIPYKKNDISHEISGAVDHWDFHPRSSYQKEGRVKL